MKVRIQHIAVATDDLILAIADMRSRELSSLYAYSTSVYDAIPERKDRCKFKRRHQWASKAGYYDWCWMKKVGPTSENFHQTHWRPTNVVLRSDSKRMGARGFSAGNFKALFVYRKRTNVERNFIIVVTNCKHKKSVNSGSFLLKYQNVNVINLNRSCNCSCSNIFKQNIHYLLN
jgi:hypothetical protein